MRTTTSRLKEGEAESLFGIAIDIISKYTDYSKDKWELILVQYGLSRPVRWRLYFRAFVWYLMRCASKGICVTYHDLQALGLERVYRMMQLFDKHHPVDCAYRPAHWAGTSIKDIVRMKNSPVFVMIEGRSKQCPL